MSLLTNGQQQPSSTWNRFSEVNFAIQQALTKMQTCTLVEVLSCTNAGELSPIGTVNVRPLVNQVDANGNPYPHTTIYNVPYFRLGSSNGNGIILDPSPGDLGLACFASRDLSQVINTQAQANPGSSRRYDFSDCLYVGLMLSNGAPTQYVQFNSAGIKIVSPTAITLQAPQINLQGQVNQTDGTINAETDVTAGSPAISLVSHTHTSAAPGNPTSPPLP